MLAQCSKHNRLQYRYPPHKPKHGVKWRSSLQGIPTSDPSIFQSSTSTPLGAVCIASLSSSTWLSHVPTRFAPRLLPSRDKPAIVDAVTVRGMARGTSRTTRRLKNEVRGAGIRTAVRGAEVAKGRTVYESFMWWLPEFPSPYTRTSGSLRWTSDAVGCASKFSWACR